MSIAIVTEAALTAGGRGAGQIEKETKSLITMMERAERLGHVMAAAPVERVQSAGELLHPPLKIGHSAAVLELNPYKPLPPTGTDRRY